jgi:hypothetical protein
LDLGTITGPARIVSAESVLSMPNPSDSSRWQSEVVWDEVMAIYRAEHLVSLLAASPAVLNDGLSDQEFADVEARHFFQFGPDHRELLQLALPAGEGRPDWRHGDETDLRTRLDWPVDGALFDVEHNAFWPRSSGEGPEDTAAALDAARTRLIEVPKLVPVYGHRYLPAAPCE